MAEKTLPARKPETRPAKTEKKKKTRARKALQTLGSRRNWASNIAREQLQALGTHLLARRHSESFQTIAITSALAGEGKTTISLSLAQLLAEAGLKVLLIDLDSHRRNLSRLLGFDDSSSQNGNGAVPRAVETELPGVSVIPAQALHLRPILQQSALQDLLDKTRTGFDIVLLDCPPMLPVADAHIIGAVADRAILVIRAGLTPHEIVDQAINDLGRDKILGAVLNRVQPSNIPYFKAIYGYYRRGAKQGRS